MVSDLPTQPALSDQTHFGEDDTGWSSTAFCLNMGFPGGVIKKEPACQCRRLRDACSIPGTERASGGGHGTHSSILAWRIPWTEEPGGLESTESKRVRHGWSDLAGTYDYQASTLERAWSKEGDGGKKTWWESRASVLGQTPRFWKPQIPGWLAVLQFRIALSVERCFLDNNGS